jgi:hypothetical protein
MCCGEIQRRFTVATPAMTFTDENLATVITFETLKEFFGFVRWDSGIVRRELQIERLETFKVRALRLSDEWSFAHGH